MSYDRMVGDKGQTLTLVVEDNGQSLSGGTPQVKLKKPDGELLIKGTGDGVSLDADLRTVSYVWESGVLDQSGNWYAYGHVTVGAIQSHCLPELITVGPVR